MTCRNGVPATVTVATGQMPVAQITDEWLVEDEWWRRPLARRYVRLLLADDRVLTLFEDLVQGGWYLQRYTAPPSERLPRAV